MSRVRLAALIFLMASASIPVPVFADEITQENVTLRIGDELVRMTSGSVVRVVNRMGFAMTGTVSGGGEEALEVHLNTGETKRIRTHLIVGIEVLEGPELQRSALPPEPEAKPPAPVRPAPPSEPPQPPERPRKVATKPRAPRKPPALSERVQRIRESWLERRTRDLGFMIGAMESPRWADLRRRIRGFEYESEFQFLQWYREDEFASQNGGVHDTWLFRQRLAIGLSDWIGFWFDVSFHLSSFEQDLHLAMGEPRQPLRREIDDLGSYTWGVQHGFLLHRRESLWVGLYVAFACQLGLGASWWDSDGEFPPTFHDVEDDEYDGARRASGARLDFEGGFRLRPSVALSLNTRYFSVQVDCGGCMDPLFDYGNPAAGCGGFGAAGRLPLPSIYSELSLLAEASVATGAHDYYLVGLNLMLDLQLPVARVGVGYRRLVASSDYWGGDAVSIDGGFPHVLVFRLGLRFDPWARNLRDP